MTDLKALITEIDDLESRLRIARHRFSQEKRLYCNERGITFLRDEQLRRELMEDAAMPSAPALALRAGPSSTVPSLRASIRIAGGKNG